MRDVWRLWSPRTKIICLIQEFLIWFSVTLCICLKKYEWGAGLSFFQTICPPAKLTCPCHSVCIWQMWRLILEWLLQEIALFGEFSIRETLIYFGWIANMPTKEVEERIDFLIALLQLPNPTRWEKLFLKVKILVKTEMVNWWFGKKPSTNQVSHT